MNPLAKLRSNARRCAVVAFSSAVLVGSAAAAPAPLDSSEAAPQVADKKIKSKATGRKIT